MQVQVSDKGQGSYKKCLLIQPILQWQNRVITKWVPKSFQQQPTAKKIVNFCDFM